MRLRAAFHRAKHRLGVAGESCCLGRSQAALGKTIERRADQDRPAARNR